MHQINLNPAFQKAINAKVIAKNNFYDDYRKMVASLEDTNQIINEQTNDNIRLNPLLSLKPKKIIYQPTGFYLLFLGTTDYLSNRQRLVPAKIMRNTDNGKYRFDQVDIQEVKRAPIEYVAITYLSWERMQTFILSCFDYPTDIDFIKDVIRYGSIFETDEYVKMADHQSKPIQNPKYIQQLLDWIEFAQKSKHLAIDPQSIDEHIEYHLKPKQQELIPINHNRLIQQLATLTKIQV